MAIENTPVATGDITRTTGRAHKGHRTGGEQDGPAGGFSAVLDAAETAATDAAPDTSDAGDGTTPRKRRLVPGADDGAAGGTATDASLLPGVVALPAAGTVGGTAVPAGTAADAAVGKVGAKGASAGQPGAAGNLLAPGGGNQMPHEASEAAASSSGAVTGGATPPGVTALAAATAATAAIPAAAAATTATTAAAVDAAAGVARGTSAPPVEGPVPAPVLPSARTLASAAGAADATTGPVDGVPPYQANFARMQRALAHAPAGGKGAAADAATSAARDLGATVSTLASAMPAGQGVASTVSLGENAQTRLAGALAELTAGPRVADGAGAGRPGESGGRGARDEQDGRDAPGVGAVPLGFGATAALDSSGWNNGFSPATAVAGDPADAGGRTAEEVLADRIGNWVHQKTQSAELTLDAFGGSPVDVRISMTGSEAHVAFQSGSAETRQLLGGALDQLRDLLQSQGLVLSGVSVGGSDTPRGDGQPGAREGAGRGRGATPAVGRTAEETTAVASVPAASQRALDVFI